MDTTYGRSRDSIANISETLDTIFSNHPESRPNPSDPDDGSSVIPARFLPDVFKRLGEMGLTVLSQSEEEQLQTVLAQLDDEFMVTGEMLIGLLAGLTKSSQDEEEEEEARGRFQYNANPQPRSSSRDSSDSNGSANTSRNHSRPPSRGVPQTPRSGSSSQGSSTTNLLDSSKRQRSTPLSAAPPSAFQRRPPHHRRKSSASPGRGYSSGGGNADSDGPVSGSGRRSRAGSSSQGSAPPAGILSPSSANTPLSPSGSPTLTHRGGFLAEGYSSPEDSSTPSSAGPYTPSASSTAFPRSGGRRAKSSHPSAGDFDFLHDSVSSLPMPSASYDSDSSPSSSRSNSPTESLYTHLMYDPTDPSSLPRSTTSSTASLDPEARLDVLTRANAGLARRLQDAENALSRTLTDHENELEELQQRLDELRAELNSTKREEKELRAKERRDSAQIGEMESEVNRLTKQLDQARSTYSHLQKQYTEQCALSEKYRLDLRSREESIRSLNESLGLHQLEATKNAEREAAWEERVGRLEREVEVAREGCGELEVQKQENMLLKETIDRMRFEMDEMRNAMSSGIGTGLGVGPGSGANSRAGTMSKSLGAELQSQLEKEREREEREEEERARKERELQARLQRDFALPAEPTSEGSTVEGDDDGEDTEVEELVEDDGEDGMITTIIRRTRRKVASAAQAGVPTPRKREKRIEVEEHEREYADCGIQYDTDILFHEEEGFWLPAETQTDAIPEPEPRVQVQVEREIVHVPVPEEAKLMTSMEIQTDPVEDEPESSSSETTPKSSAHELPASVPSDEPPAYPGGPSAKSREVEAAEAAEREEQAEQVEWDTLRKWHRLQGGEERGDLKELLMAAEDGEHQKRTKPSKGFRGLSRWWSFSSSPSKSTKSVGRSLEGRSDILQDWARVKGAVGVECGVVERLVLAAAVAEAERNASSSSSRIEEEDDDGVDVDAQEDEEPDTNASSSRLGRLSKRLPLPETFSILNIPGASAALSYIPPTVVYGSLSLLVGLVLAPHMAQHLQDHAYGGYNEYYVPGGAGPYDRRAWATYNALAGGGEGFPGVGFGRGGGAEGAFWKIVEVLIGGGARYVRGLPT